MNLPSDKDLWKEAIRVSIILILIGCCFLVGCSLVNIWYQIYGL